MILPSKHLPERRALLTIGGVILKLLETPRTVSSLWEKLRSGESKMHRNISYDWFVLALDLLFLVDAVTLHDGLLIKARATV